MHDVYLQGQTRLCMSPSFECSLVGPPHVSARPLGHQMRDWQLAHGKSVMNTWI